MEPLLELTSHIAGKNAQVRLWPDRLEWSRKGRVSRAEADRLTGQINALINGTHPALQAPTPAPVAPPPIAPQSAGPAQRLQELAQLHAQGILTDAEYAAAKAQALGL